MSRTHDIRENGAFCVMPWLHLHITTTGHFTLCCISNKRIADENGEPFHIMKHTLEEVWSSSDLNSIRSAMAAGDKVPHCRICYDYESAAGSSTRIGLNAWLLDNHERSGNNKDIIDRNLSDGGVPPIPGYVDIRLSNLCNLGCRMCSSDASSTIEKDDVHVKWSPYTGPKPDQSTNVESIETLARRGMSAETIVGRELAKFDDLYFIQLAGGEPTINAAQVGWLRGLAESGQSKNISLSIWTNFTTSNRKIFDFISTFHSVTLTLSIDGYGDMYEYIRHPGRWSMIEGNLNYIAPFRGRLYLKLNCVVQAYNALNIVNLMDWAQKNDIEVMLHNVTPQMFLDYRILSDDMRKKIREVWSEYRDKAPDTSVGRSIRASIDKVLSQTSEDFSEEDRRAHLDMFIKFTNDLDRKRKQSIKESAPEIYEDIVRSLGKWDSEGRFTQEQ